ncbi:MAG: peptidase MA family metallohydrolase [Chloroflexota bacterium]
MMTKLGLIRSAAAVILAVAVLIATGCSASAPVAPPSPLPPPTVVPSPTTPPSKAPETPPVPTPQVRTKPAPAEVSLTVNRATIEFPARIIFSLEGTSVKPVKSLTLEYGTDKRSIIEEVTRVEPAFAPGSAINTRYTWEMKKSGGALPPGATVWWRWRITDDLNREFLSPRNVTTFVDTRFQWQIKQLDLLDIYWQGDNASLVNDLTSGLEAMLSRVRLGVNVPSERKIKVFIYPNVEQLKAAMLFPQDWTGAVAFSQYNIVLVPVNASNLSWAQGALAHEITHLLVGEAVFGPFDDIPVWLNEGLAEYAEENNLTVGEKNLIDSAMRENRLISVRSLSSNFPTDSQQAYLSYAESKSIVIYLINRFGWEKMRELLAVFKDGATYDSALKKVFGLDSAALDKQWRDSLPA